MDASFLRGKHVSSVGFISPDLIPRNGSQAILTKAGTTMYEDEDDDRFEAALRLAEDDPARGAEALRSIVADDAFDPDTRSEAAARLAEVDG